MTNKLYTIGYSKYTLDLFVDILNRHGINAIADVRSTPFSRFKPEFNSDQLSQFLISKGIKYVFLGKECGAKFDDRSCYVNGKADYNLIARHNNFIKGIDRVREGLKKFTVALMCAENDPINCHRMILICRNLKQFKIPIYHILNIDEIEPNDKTERRLLKLYNLDQLALFDSEDDQLELAYDRQGEKIAFTEAPDPTKINTQGDVFDE